MVERWVLGGNHPSLWGPAQVSVPIFPRARWHPLFFFFFHDKAFFSLRHLLVLLVTDSQNKYTHILHLLYSLRCVGRSVWKGPYPFETHKRIIFVPLPSKCPMHHAHSLCICKSAWVIRALCFLFCNPHALHETSALLCIILFLAHLGEYFMHLALLECRSQTSVCIRIQTLFPWYFCVSFMNETTTMMCRHCCSLAQ